MKVKSGSDPARVVMRRARAADKTAVLDFCRNTFGRWGDYMPEVWDKWLRDKSGFFMAAEVGGTPVGVGKITEQRPGALWLEGLRVDPAWRGLGIGRVIQEFTWRKAMSLRPEVIRYATGSYNKISQHLGRSKSMRIAAEFDEYEARPLPAAAARLVRASDGDLGPALRLFERGVYGRRWHGLMLEGWVAKTFDRAALAELIRRRRVHLYIDERGLAGALVHLRSKDKKRFNYCRVAARDPRTFKLVLREGRRLAASMGAQKMQMHLPRALRGKKTVAGTNWRNSISIWMVIMEWKRNRPE